MCPFLCLSPFLKVSFLRAGTVSLHLYIPHLALLNIEAVLLIKWLKQYMYLYIYIHLACPCSHIFSVYFLYYIWKIYSFVIIFLSVIFYRNAYPMHNLEISPIYSHMYLWIFIAKCVLATRNEKQEQCNSILICFQFNSHGVDTDWLQSGSWERTHFMILCDFTFYLLQLGWVGWGG